MNLRTAVLAALVFANFPARADPDWNSVLDAYYMMGAVAKNCKGLGLGSAETGRMMATIAFAEGKAGISGKEHASRTAEATETVTTDDAACKTLGPNMHDMIKNLPPLD